MKSIRMFAAGVGVLASQAAFATDRTARPSADSEPMVEILFEESQSGLPEPALVAHTVGVGGLHLVAVTGIALCLMTRRRKTTV